MKSPNDHLNKPSIAIEYCTGCRWLPRSAWIAQELLYTFKGEIKEVSLRPNLNESGCFQISSGGALIWCRERDNGFPEIKNLKQKIRDLIAPGKELGHSES